jgi:hypothetical protein
VLPSAVTVPEVGNVKAVVPPTVKVVPYAPLIVSVDAALLATPVPPEAGTNTAERPAAVPLVFWFSVGNVQLVSVPEIGIPSTGVTKVGLVASTILPDPVVALPSAVTVPEVGNVKAVVPLTVNVVP